MQGHVVQVASVGGHAEPLRYYVICDEAADAMQLLRTTFASDRDWAISILRPVAAWEVDAFQLAAGEVRQAP
ncbi:MAG: hypothetical protein NT015_17630 [Alphaproteobacteria bacterium]|nr:hypothetical protein [Alphaproteobacteria bacterium]